MIGATSDTRAGALRTYLGEVHHPRGISYPSEKIEASDVGRMYYFNKLGYRSEELNQSAKLKIFTAGCSYTFGTGVADADIWTAQLKSRLVDQLGLSSADVNILNFSQVGASNHYICRTMLEQCQQAKPDLAIVCFTHADRTECFAGTDIENIGPWRIPKKIESKDDLSSAAWRYMFYENGVGNFETLKLMAVLHSAFQRQGIPYIFFWVEHAILHGQEIASCEGLQALAAMTHMMHLQNFSILSPQIFVDREAGHPGRESHKRFAEKVSTIAPFYLRPRVVAPSASGRQGGIRGYLSNVLRRLPPPRTAMYMGSWDCEDLARSRRKGLKAQLHEERIQSLDYVIRRLPSISRDAIDHVAIMDSRPHFREVCFRDNFLEFDLRDVDKLPAPLAAVAQSSAQYMHSGTLVGQHLLNMLAVLAVSEMSGGSTLLMSKVDLSKLGGRMFAPWLNELSGLAVRPGLFSSNYTAGQRLQSHYEEIRQNGSSIADLASFTARTPPWLDDARLLGALLNNSRRSNGFDSDRNNYSLG